MSNLKKNAAPPAYDRRVMLRNSSRGHKITVVKPKSNLHIILAIFCGIIIGLIASSLLVFVGGRFF